MSVFLCCLFSLNLLHALKKTFGFLRNQPTQSFLFQFLSIKPCSFHVTTQSYSDSWKILTDSYTSPLPQFQSEVRKLCVQLRKGRGRR